MSAAARVRFLEHTADVGLEISASTLADVFRAAAAGIFELLLGAHAHELERSGLPEETRAVTLEADDVGQLLVDWLRELLYWHDIDRLAFVRAEFDTVSARQLAATVYCAHYTSPPVREIKGVTYHQLTVEQRGAAWFARVIFDV